MKLADITMNVAYKVWDMGSYKAAIVIVDHQDGDINIWDFSKERMTCSTTTWHDFFDSFEGVESQDENLTLQYDWSQLDVEIKTTIDEINLIRTFVEEYLDHLDHLDPL